MKKLTAGIFATLVVLVSVGMARADIASTKYVDGQLESKEDTANRMNTPGEYTRDAAINAEKYPTVSVAEYIANEAVRNQVGDLNTTLGNYELADNKVSAVPTNEKDKSEKFPTVALAEQIAHQEIESSLEDFGFARGEGGSVEIPYELADNKVSAVPTNEKDKSEKFPTVALTEQMINSAVGEVASGAADDYQPKDSVLTALSGLTASDDCKSGGGCVLKYDGTTFTLEAITRSESESGEGQQQQ